MFQTRAICLYGKIFIQQRAEGRVNTYTHTAFAAYVIETATMFAMGTLHKIVLVYAKATLVLQIIFKKNTICGS